MDPNRHILFILMDCVFFFGSGTVSALSVNLNLDVNGHNVVNQQDSLSTAIIYILISLYMNI